MKEPLKWSELSYLAPPNIVGVPVKLHDKQIGEIIECENEWHPERGWQIKFTASIESGIIPFDMSGMSIGVDNETSN